MNLLVIFKILLLAIVVFFVLYCLMYKRLEGFKCQYDPTSSVPLHYAELDNEIQACLNNVSNYVNRRLDNRNIIFYKLNGTDSNIYINDYFDNFFDISFAVKFNGQLQNGKVVLENDFIKIYTKDVSSKIKLAVRFKRTGNVEEKVFSNIELNLSDTYILKLFNSKTIRKTEVLFGKFVNRNNDSLLSKLTKPISNNVCDNQSGNHIFIGCSNAETENIDIDVGDFVLNIDKSKYDDLTSNGVNSPPTLLVCASEEDSTEDEGDDDKSVVESEADYLTDDFLQIKIDLSLQDLQRKFKGTIEDDKNRTDIESINTYFGSLTEKSEVITDFFREARLEKDKSNDIFEDSYNNLSHPVDVSNNYFAFSISNNQRNADIVKTFNFLNQTQINYINSELNDNIYIFIFGKRAHDTSVYKFLQIKNPIFIAVYNRVNNPIYYFEPIEINLDLLYDYIKDFAKKKLADPNLTYGDYFQIKIANNVEPDSEIKYKKNFFRRYNDRIDLGDINVNVFEKKTDLVKSLLIRYKKEEETVGCSFNPKGETRFDCLQKCREFSQGCTDIFCRDLCNNCDNSLCKWTILDSNVKKSMLPSDIRLKGFGGDTKVKLSWIKPLSPFPILGYYIMVSSTINETQFDLYVYEGTEDMIEYFISNLINDIPYSFYVFSKNKVGISESSNRATIIPKKNKILNQENVSKNTYSDSIQNFYRNKSSNDNTIIDSLNKNISHMNLLSDINDLKDILIKKISEKRLKPETNFNIF